MSLTDLTYAKFDRADLKGANLSNALLNYADFAGATLHGANLKGANLYHAKNFTPAQLKRALAPSLRSCRLICRGLSGGHAAPNQFEQARPCGTTKPTWLLPNLRTPASRGFTRMHLSIFRLISSQPAYLCRPILSFYAGIRAGATSDGKLKALIS